MSSKFNNNTYEGGSPWASTSFLPFPIIPSRRISITSLSSRNALDRDTLSQALDNIHSSASQTTSLITFKDFAPPPAPPKDEERSSAQTGLGGLYARLRPSSGHNKDRAPPTPLSKQRKPPSEIRNEDVPPTPSTPSLEPPDPPNPTVPPTSKHAEGPPQSPKQEIVEHSLGSEVHQVAPNYSQMQLAPQQDRDFERSSFDEDRKHDANLTIETDLLAYEKHQSDQDRIVPSRPPKPDSDGAGFKKVTSPTGEDEFLRQDHGSQDQHHSPSSALATPTPLMSLNTHGLAPPQLAAEIIKARNIPFTAVSKMNIPAPSPSEFTESNHEADIPTAKLNAHSPATGKSPGGPGITGQTNHNLMYEMRRKVLSRDFWMKDDNAKACFNCGDTFTAFRRKHHCRTCGQIYDAKCTVLLPGHLFDREGRLRICKTCENLIVGDDSSDYSEDEQSMPASHGKSIRFSGFPTAATYSNSKASGSDTGQSDAIRPALDPRQRCAPGVFDNTAPSLTRPDSSRSLKSISSRPRSASHRYRRSRHQHVKSFPQNTPGGSSLDLTKIPANPSSTKQTLQTDDIIDPDLAPFMSDEGSSDEEHHTIASALHGSLPSSHGTSAWLGKRPRPRPGSFRGFQDSTQHTRDPDNISIRSSRPSARRRQANRTISMSSAIVWPALSPRLIRSENLFTDGYDYFGNQERAGNAGANSEAVYENVQQPLLAELNRPSLEHFKTLLKQLLQDAHIDQPRKWESILSPILLRCAEEVDPNIQRGDDIDIRHYVKLKKAPGGKIHDTKYISGVVFSKNMALKGMRREIKEARLLLISFPIVYTRHQQHFISLDAVIAQEKEYLRNIVRRIVALAPDVILAQQHAAGFALELLKEANITVACNVKESVLQAVSRCTQTQVVSSVDKLSMDTKYLGRCESFEFKTIMFGTYKKSYAFVSGCQRDLGCTIVLRGDNKSTLYKIKWITEFMCYVAYNLKLETSLIRDQFSLTPNYALTTSHETQNRSETDSITEPRSKDQAVSETPHQSSLNKAKKSHESSATTAASTTIVSSDTVEAHDDLCEFANIHSVLNSKILSISPAVTLSEPHLLVKGLEQEKFLTSLKRQHHKLEKSDPKFDAKSANKTFELISPEITKPSPVTDSQQNHETLKAIRDVEYAKAHQYYTTLRRRWESFVSGGRDPFNPLSHQQLVVQFSIVSMPSMNACEGPDLLGLGFYVENNVDHDVEPDMPLGEYVERTCDQAKFRCISDRCDKKMIDHHRHYIHGDGQVTIIVEQQPSKLRGLDNTILMWSICRECQQETPVVPMSRNTWKYSFAKYLELSFWSRHLAPRAGICPHDIHKSHVRYFGFNNLAISVKYDPIKIMEISVPRNVIFWKVEKDISIKNDQYLRIEDSLQRFSASVVAKIESINLGNVKEKDQEKCCLEVEAFKQRAHDEHDFLKQKLQDKYRTSQYFEIIPLNRAVRALQEKVAGWDSTFADFEQKYFPSEKDIRKLATQELKHAYLSENEISDLERTDEKDELRSIRSIFEVPHEELGQAPTELRNTANEPSSILREGFPSARKIATVQEASKATDIPVGQNASRMVDELDLAKSPESPTARKKAAALDEPSNTPPSEIIEVHSDMESSDILKGAQAETSKRNNSPEDDDMAASARRCGGHASPYLVRSRTQPPPALRNTPSYDSTGAGSPRVPHSNAAAPSLIPVTKGTPILHRAKTNTLKPSTNVVSAALQAGKTSAQSMIPRSKYSRRIETRVSALAKHFEQMSREFERERLRERRQRAARVFQAQVYSTASLQPVVEVFKDANAAVNEQEHAGNTAGDVKYAPSLSSETQDIPTTDQSSILEHINEHLGSATDNQRRGKIDRKSEESSINALQSFSDNEALTSDVEPSTLTDSEEFASKIESGLESPDDMQLEFLDIPKHDKTSIMKMLTSFWSERSASGWTPLEYPLSPTDHIFADSDVIFREDEPSSLIAFALNSKDYLARLERFKERVKTEPLSTRGTDTGETDVERTLLGTTATHVKYHFQAGPARMLCQVFYAESFDAIRQRCGVSERFVESLSRCVKWDSRGGKTKSIFLKTLDERFVMKSLSQTEARAFLQFAPDYFDYMSKCLFHRLPSALAKILGIYQVIIKNPYTGVDFGCFLQVMENVFYEGPSDKMFDLKGSMRNRKVQSTGELNEVLLDENLLDYISQAPIYVRNHANSYLASSITNDTLFCSKQNVMDYSLIVGLYDDRQELMVGIIDYIRTYTWDKKLESWIKDRGKNKPTVRSPKEYRNRFRASIARYFPLAPSCWQMFGGQRIEPPRAWWDSLGAARGESQQEPQQAQQEEDSLRESEA